MINKRRQQTAKPQDQRTKTITGRFEPVKYPVSVFIIIIIVGKKLDRRTYGKNYN